MRAAILLLCALNAMAQTAITLPDGQAGIGFDDLRYDAALKRVIAPAGRTGNVDLIDPATQKVTAIGGFTHFDKNEQGHGESVTSADTDGKWLFATDRNARQLAIVDLTTKKIVSRAPLKAGPDYVRWVAPTGEIWVTEPRAKGIEIFSFTDGKATHKSFLATPGGPESLVIDAKRGRAYTHQWKKSTYAVDLKSHRIVATWAAGCDDPRGIALDEARGFLFIGCEDGTASALDVAHDGHLLSTAKSGSGVDIIAYDPGRAHLYLPGDESATLAIIGVGADGKLTVLGTAPTVKEAHCVATDESGHAYVCDPEHGRLLVITDSYPPSH